MPDQHLPPGQYTCQLDIVDGRPVARVVGGPHDGKTVIIPHALMPISEESPAERKLRQIEDAINVDARGKDP